MQRKGCQFRREGYRLRAKGQLAKADKSNPPLQKWMSATTAPVDVARAVEGTRSDAEKAGWAWRKVNGHAWGQLLCAHQDRDGCRISIWSTPRDPENHARQIRRVVNRCTHKEEVKDGNI